MKCEECEGTGQIVTPEGDTKKCHRCGGSGVTVTPDEGPGQTGGGSTGH